MALEKECLQETAVKFWPAEEQKAEKYWAISAISREGHLKTRWSFFFIFPSAKQQKAWFR